MKVIQIGATYNNGGPGGTTANIHQALMANGIESAVYQIFSKSTDSQVYKSIGPFSYFFWRILRRLRLNLSKCAYLRTHKLIRMIRKQNPDVIHLRILHHGIYDFKLLFNFLSKYGKPVVFTLHDMWLLTGGCYHFLDINCIQYKIDCSKCHKSRIELDCFPFSTNRNFELKKHFVSRIENFHLVAVSEWVKEEIRESHLRDYPCTVIRNAVDISTFKPHSTSRDLRDGRRYVVIGVANMWSRLKGLDDFYKVSMLLGADYQIILVGKIPTGINYHADNIRLLGPINSSDELARLYSDADVFVHLSRQETFGMVLAEAACCGKKVIGYNISAIPEVIKIAKGEIVETGDIEGICTKVRNICENAILLHGIELEKVREAFSKQNMTDSHIKLYKELYDICRRKG